LRRSMTYRTGAVAATTLLAATLAITQAGPAMAASSLQVAYEGTNGDIFTYQLGSGTASDLGYQLRSGTNPSTVAGQTASNTLVNSTISMLYLYPWPTNNDGDGPLGVLWNDTTLPMEPGSSPSVTTSSLSYTPWNATCSQYPVCSYNGLDYDVAFDTYTNTAQNELAVRSYNPATGFSVGTDTGETIATGTSPAMATDTDSFSFVSQGQTIYSQSQAGQADFQGSNGDLWYWGWEEQNGDGNGQNPGGGDTGIAMASGTSPALTADNYDASGGPEFAVAVRAADGNMLLNAPGLNSPFDSGDAMAAGTSPAIASDGTTLWAAGLDPAAHVDIAFQGSNGTLYTWSSTTGSATSVTGLTVDTGFAMASGTSPAIAWNGSNYQIAFHGANGHLWLYSPASGATDTGIVMANGTSPSIG
jgi:hypothetical protein